MADKIYKYIPLQINPQLVKEKKISLKLLICKFGPFKCR